MLKNQNGLTSIMFAMIFATIVTLLVIGFATLVRNDLRQVADQNLGYVAQYAAETAVNQVAAELSSNPAATQIQASCIDFDLKNPSGVNVTCVTWTDRGKEIFVSVLNNEPYASRINTGASVNSTIQIEYSADFKGTYGGAATLPVILNDRYPVLKLSLLQSGSIVTRNIYIVPTAGGGSSNLPGDGELVAASCNAQKCVINLTSTGNFLGDISIQAIGQDAKEVFIRALDAGGTPLTMLEAQYTIGANAIAQDVTKRVEARIPYGKQTWRPASALSANKACKDIKIDGDNSTSASPPNAIGSACPVYP